MSENGCSMMMICGSWLWVLGRRFPLFPEEILTKQGNVFIRLPRLFQLYLIRKLPRNAKESKTCVKLQFCGLQFGCVSDFKKIWDYCILSYYLPYRVEICVCLYICNLRKCISLFLKIIFDRSWDCISFKLSAFLCVEICVSLILGGGSYRYWTVG